MRAPAILITLLYVQTVTSFQERGPAGCSVPCKTRLRLTESKMIECLEINCGPQDTMSKNRLDSSPLRGEEDSKTADFDGKSRGCLSGSKRLRYPERQGDIEEDSLDKEIISNENDNTTSSVESQHHAQNPCVARCNMRGQTNCSSMPIR